MMREAVHIGLSVRLVSHCLDVPPGTEATVDTVSTLWDGTWCFTVRWQSLKPLPGRKHRSDRSLNLWESDLDKFEAVTQEKGDTSLPAQGQPTSLVRPHRKEQLTLPFGDL